MDSLPHNANLALPPILYSVCALMRVLYICERKGGREGERGREREREKERERERERVCERERERERERVAILPRQSGFLYQMI